MSSTDVCDLGHAMTCNKTGVKVEKGQRFGFHNLRHSLASFLVTKKTDVKPAQYASCQEHNHARPLHANRHGRADRGAGAGARMAHFLSCRYHVCSVVFCTAFLSSSMDALKETGYAAHYIIGDTVPRAGRVCGGPVPGYCSMGVTVLLAPPASVPSVRIS